MNLSSPSTPATIGIFDSGVGGLSVLHAIRQQLPCQPAIYLADQAHVPYGARTKDEVRAYSEEITRFLLKEGARLIVVACNTASAAALFHLRRAFPDVPFVGMEPAVKPAAAATRSGVVGVLATPVTFQGELYASVVERFAKGVTVLEDTCPGLVGEIEAGHLNGPKTREILERALRPMLQQGVDTIVMGCTHYPFVIPLIEEIAGPKVQVIDPSPAVARQAKRLLENRGWLVTEPDCICRNEKHVDCVRFFTTGSLEQWIGKIPPLLGEKHPMQIAHWHYRKLDKV